MGKNILAIIAMVTLAVGCGNINEIDDQRTSIASYINGKSYEYQQFGNAYRCIIAEQREGEFDVIGRDSTFMMNFASYIFTSSPSTLYYTNVRSLFESGLADTDTTYWNFTPLEVTLGKTELLKGLENSLAGCRYGDSVEVFLCSDEAYGSKGSGIVPGNSAVMFAIRILEKQ